MAISGQNGGGMPTYSIAKANDNLSQLVDEAVAGEEVAITRHGKVVAYVVSMSSMLFFRSSLTRAFSVVPFA